LIKLFIVCLFLFVNLDAFTLQKAKIYKDQNISGWVVSEKLDGIRAYWDTKELRTKNNKIINAPAWFRDKLPPFKLDGELWSKRGDFENIYSIVMQKTPDSSWKQIKYMIFEAPDASGDFYKRMSKVQKYIEIHKLSYLKVIEQKKVSDAKSLDILLDEVVKKGGEGLMLKDASREYFSGRSNSILKVKKAHDMEAEVIGYKKGKGKFSGMMGSLQVKLKNGVIFFIGSGFDKSDRINPPKIGSIVTFKYYGFTKHGKPKFASYIRQRRD